MEYRRPQSYEERFLSVSTWMERMLFRIAMLGFAGIILSQLVLSVPALRDVFSVTDRLEGQQISQNRSNPPSQTTGFKQLTIRPVNDKPVTAWVKINGVPVGQITQSGITVKITKKEILEIDTSSQEGIYRFEIDHNDPSITYPPPGTLVETSQTHAAVVEPVLAQD